MEGTMTATQHIETENYRFPYSSLNNTNKQQTPSSLPPFVIPLPQQHAIEGHHKEEGNTKNAGKHLDVSDEHRPRRPSGGNQRLLHSATMGQGQRLSSELGEPSLSQQSVPDSREEPSWPFTSTHQLGRQFTGSERQRRADVLLQYSETNNQTDSVSAALQQRNPILFAKSSTPIRRSLEKGSARCRAASLKPTKQNTDKYHEMVGLQHEGGNMPAQQQGNVNGAYRRRQERCLSSVLDDIPNQRQKMDIEKPSSSQQHEDEIIKSRMIIGENLRFQNSVEYSPISASSQQVDLPYRRHNAALSRCQSQPRTMDRKRSTGNHAGQPTDGQKALKKQLQPLPRKKVSISNQSSTSHSSSVFSSQDQQVPTKSSRKVTKFANQEHSPTFSSSFSYDITINEADEEMLHNYYDRCSQKSPNQAMTQTTATVRGGSSEQGVSGFDQQPQQRRQRSTEHQPEQRRCYDQPQQCENIHRPLPPLNHQTKHASRPTTTTTADADREKQQQQLSDGKLKRRLVNELRNYSTSMDKQKLIHYFKHDGPSVPLTALGANNLSPAPNSYGELNRESDFINSGNSSSSALPTTTCCQQCSQLVLENQRLQDQLIAEMRRSAIVAAHRERQEIQIEDAKDFLLTLLHDSSDDDIGKAPTWIMKGLYQAIEFLIGGKVALGSPKRIPNSNSNRQFLERDNARPRRSSKQPRQQKENQRGSNVEPVEHETVKRLSTLPPTMPSSALLSPSSSVVPPSSMGGNAQGKSGSNARVLLGSQKTRKMSTRSYDNEVDERIMFPFSSCGSFDFQSLQARPTANIYDQQSQERPHDDTTRTKHSDGDGRQRSEHHHHRADGSSSPYVVRSKTLGASQRYSKATIKEQENDSTSQMDAKSVVGVDGKIATSNHHRPVIPRLGLEDKKVGTGAWLGGEATQGDTYMHPERK